VAKPLKFQLVFWNLLPFTRELNPEKPIYNNGLPANAAP
jgi:hypothetical protein